MKSLLRRIVMMLLATGLATAICAQTAQPSVEQKKTQTRKAAAVHQDPAERAFQTHCSRCHSAPETLSPSLTGTVVRHMRVRANLSAEEERLIYSFFNP
jgi:cytochrome c5